MATTYYQNEDQVPVFIQVLDITAYFYSQIKLKIAILNHYQELKIPPALWHPNEPVMILITSAVNDIKATMERTAKIYALNLYDFLNSDPRITQLAEDIYWSLISDEFPECITEEDADYFEPLELHVLSILRVLSSISEIFYTGATDPDKIFEKPEHLLEDCNVDPKNKKALMQLLQLKNRLCINLEKINKYSLTFNLK
jgi:hypothetical protein